MTAILEDERASDVHEYILASIAQQKDMLSVLRVMCLACLCDGGFKQKVFELYRRELVQVRSSGIGA